MIAEKFGRFPFYRQFNQMDCGPTCLRMISKYYGKNISIETLRKLAELSRNGSSVFGISVAAEQVGFKTMGCKLTFNQLLKDAQKPCILYWKQNHFVILVPGRHKSKITIADPAAGLVSISKKDFVKAWITHDEKGIALLLEPTAALRAQKEDVQKGIGWKSLGKYLWEFKPHLIQLFLGLLLGSVIQLVFPFLTQSIVDYGINGHNLNFIELILFAQSILLLAQTLTEFIRGRILMFISTHINLKILSAFWMKLMKLPLYFFDTRHTGDILQRITDHKRIESFVTGTTLFMFFSLFNVIIFSFVLLLYDKTIFLTYLGFNVLYFIWITLFLKQRRNLDYQYFSLSAQENTSTMQMLVGMQEIKLNNAERIKRWKWEEIQSQIFKVNFKSLSLDQYQAAGAFFISQGKNIVITFMVAKLVLDGHLTLGSMLAIQYIIGQLNGPIEQVVQFTKQAQDAKLSLERLNEIHSLQDEEPLEANLSGFVPQQADISIRNCSFSYPGSDRKQVIKNLDLMIPTGKITAIVGVSGSGKTTFLKLLQKFYEDYAGEITIGDMNLKNISPHYWRNITGSVSQDGFIFGDTIENNITVGDDTINHEKLIHACRVANILSFVQEQPLGFKTRIGADGNGISQGQRQRVLIARAVYKDPRFIFFDEATNALDANNESIIMSNLNVFFKGKTVIVVAHRLSTVKHADKIIVFDNGEIIEQGSHSVLTEQRGKYYELVKNQLELGK